MIVKNGADPVLYVEGSNYAEVPVTPVQTLIDTTAAGDGFNAGVFARHAAGDTLAKGIAYACALSRKVVQSRGALVAFDPGSIR